VVPFRAGGCADRADDEARLFWHGWSPFRDPTYLGTLRLGNLVAAFLVLDDQPDLGGSVAERYRRARLGYFTPAAAFFWRLLLSAARTPFSAAVKARGPVLVAAWPGSPSGCGCAPRTGNDRFR
jgi:hypothetical protein